MNAIRSLHPGFPLLLILLTGFLAGCGENPLSPPKKSTQARGPVPIAPDDPRRNPVTTVQHGLTLPGDRILPVEIFGKTATQIWLRQSGDENLVRTLPIEQLNEGDRDFLRQLPMGVKIPAPFRTLLTNSKGQSIDARVHGHDTRNVRISKIGDKSELLYDVPVSSLQKESQELLQLVPETVLGPIVYEMPALKQRRKDLSAAQAELKTVQLDADGKDLTCPAYKDLKANLTRAETQVKRLEVEVKALEARRQP